jgi:transposase
MDPTSFVGIDPASGDFDCALVRNGIHKVIHKKFLISDHSLNQMIEWIRNDHIEVVAIEGTGGYVAPLERALRTSDVPFYTFSAYRVSQYRKAIMGEHKNNQKDAMTVAFLAQQLAAQDDLEAYRRDWFPDEVIRPLIRLYDQKQRESTRETNRLWQVIHGISGELFLALKHPPEEEHQTKGLSQEWLLKLISSYPDIESWQAFTREMIIQEMGEHRKNIIEKMLQLKDVVKDIRTPSTVEQVTLQVTASTALALKQAVRSLYRQLEKETEQNVAARHLKTYKGIGPVISAQIVSEVADITRFPNNNHLASYAGLGRQEFKTGSNRTERSPNLYNRRLKNALMTGARCFTLYNPDSHLTGYYRSLGSRGMKQTERYKRVARALVRRFYRDLKSIAAEEESTTRHEGKPESVPVEKNILKQPHASSLV